MKAALTIVATGAVGAFLVWCTPGPQAVPRSDLPSPTAVGAAAALETVRTDARGGKDLPASPLLSRGRRVFGWSALQFPALGNVNDGDYSTAWGAGRPTPERPAWVAIDVGTGPRRLLLNWTASGSYNYEETDYGSPGAYRIETSADSTDGEDGTWRKAAEVLVATTHGGSDTFAFDGQRWVRFVVTRTPDQSPNGVQISEIDVHDVTVGASDSWFFVGDSITALAFNRAPSHQPSFAAWVHERRPGYFPVMIDGGTGGYKSDEGAAHIGDWLARNPELHFWAIGYGTNDAAGNSTDTTRFRANLQTIVDSVRGAGRVPILASIPFASDGEHRNIPAFNRVVAELRTASSLPAGPDLYAWFAAHPEELEDGVHPNDRGVVSMNRLWGEAVAALYPP
jgi:acyl-CoA thioesterase-1